MSALAKLTCEVCQEREAVGVASCMLAQPVSVAYCDECLREGREALHVVMGTLLCMTDYNYDHPERELAPWALEIIENSLEFHGKTWEWALAETRAQAIAYRAAEEEYHARLEEQANNSASIEEEISES